MREFSQQNRIEFLRKATSQQWDLCITGGGVTGAGIALDAVSRGLNVLLLEKNDFASGTSGKSTKLIHGGLRYLKNFEFGLVREVGKERRIVFENAPHVTRPEPLLLPLIKGGSLGVLGATVGLWLYDWLAGVKKSERRRMIRPASVLAMEAGLDASQIIGGAWYYEYRTDDARLTMEILKKAHELGATIVNHSEVSALYFDENKNASVEIHEKFSGEKFTVKSSVVVNAAGPWMDEVVRLQEKNASSKLLLSQGIHVVVDASRLPIGQAMYFDTADKRMIFAIPREGKVYIGTTEHVCKLEEAEIVKREHAEYLLNSVNRLFPDAHLKIQDVESFWAGVRPLILQKGKKPGEVSRKDELFEHEHGLISIAGGKLTGYRKMAERTVNVVMKRLKKSASCTTDKIRLSGSGWSTEEIQSKVNFLVSKSVESGLPEKTALAWAWRYGATAELLLANWKKDNHHNSEERWLKTELDYSIKNEMLCSTMDFLIRRTSLFYFDHEESHRYSSFIHNYLSSAFHWTEEQKRKDKENISTLYSRIQELRNNNG